MDVAINKDASVTADTEGTENIKVYSDGSAQDGKVGAAAVLIRPGKATRRLHFHLGSAEHHTVFEAELVGLLLGLHLIKTEKTRTSYALGADNQAAITAAATPSNRSGHYLADQFLTAAFNLRKINGTAKYSLTLRWTAGHVNIEGNELADKEAKLASEGATSEASTLPKILKKPLKHNKLAAKQEHKKQIKIAWSREWQKSLRAHRTKNIDASLPSLKFIKLISDLDISRKGASWLYQLRSGHIPLNAYLHRFKRVESASCPACGHHNETTQHYLLDCPAYAHERWPLITGKSPKNKEYGKLVGGPKNALPIINYIMATGRLSQEYAGRTRDIGEAGTRRGETGVRRD